MVTINETPWDDREDLPGNNDLNSPRRAADFGDEDDELGVDRDEIEEDNIDDDGPDSLLTDDDLDYEDEDITDDNDEDKDFEAHLAPESVDPDPNEIPEQEQSQQEGSGYTPNREYSQPQEGNDASYSEQNDVTPPNHKEFPSRGPGKADFESRAQGRTTGRMVGHEPGTEGI
jgi:hypothetical protein